MRDKNVDQIEDVKVALEVNGCDIATKKDREADSPDAWCIPPVAQPVLHQDEASCLIPKLLDVVRTIDH